MDKSHKKTKKRRVPSTVYDVYLAVKQAIGEDVLVSAFIVRATIRHLGYSQAILDKWDSITRLFDQHNMKIITERELYTKMPVVPGWKNCAV